MLTLGIETSCDETACAVVRDGKEILSNVISSQAAMHRKYRGVFPELASRHHIDLLLPTLEAALAEARVEREEIDLIAVTKGPGLIGALLIGLNAAKGLSLALNRPFIGVNHVEAHLYAAMMTHDRFIFPSLGVVISGGHTFLVRILEVGSYELIGTTVDDAVGEAFDKVAALLDLPYPGGPEIEKLAREGNAAAYSFKPGRVKGQPWDFSFSGIKTNVLYTVKGQDASKGEPVQIDAQKKADIAASFQQAALADIADKALRAAAQFSCKAIYFGGGVSNNGRLREMLDQAPLPVFWPTSTLSLDNAAMIAGLGYHTYLKQGKGDPLDLEPMARIPLS